MVEIVILTYIGNGPSIGANPSGKPPEMKIKAN